MDENKPAEEVAAPAENVETPVEAAPEAPVEETVPESAPVEPAA